MSGNQIPNSINAVPFRAIGFALLATIVASLLLVLSWILYLELTDPQQTRHLSLAAKQFRAVVGQARPEGEDLLVTSLAGAGPNRQAVLSLWRALDSDDFRFVSLALAPVHPGLQVKLFWRPAGDRDALFSQALPTGGVGTTTVDMSTHPDWRGQLAEIGLVLIARTEIPPVLFSGMRLESGGLRPALHNLLSEWTAFRPFDQATINRLFATFSGDGLSPVVTAAAWAALALALLGLVALTGRAVPRFSWVAVVLLVWVCLDLLWQRQLDGQLELTRHLFQGRSLAERHARDMDSEFYRHAMQLREEVLPGEPVRLFILHNSYDHNYQRLKMQYYLLPHNIYNFGLVPPEESIRPGDYVLVLGEVPSLEFDTAGGMLRWPGTGGLPAKLKHSHSLGKLYFIGGEASLSDGADAGVPAK